MIRGNKVDQVTSNLKLGLEQAQARAVSSRRAVALVLPTQESVWSTSKDDERAVLPFCFGSYRLAYVNATSTSGVWEFVRWVPDSEWKNAPEGAMLVRVLGQTTDSSDFDKFTTGDGMTGALSDPSSGNFGSRLGKLTGCKLVSSSSEKTIDNSLIVFSPYGGLKSDEDLRLVVAEAVPSGTSVVYPAKDSNGKPTNWLMLSINKFTGRVSYYPVED